MKKSLVTAMCVLCLAAFAGCAKDKPGAEPSGDVTGTPGVSEVKFETMDYEQGNRSGYMPREMMRTDKGFYHMNFKDNSLHYYDIATGKEMYLCNKPECRHDGNPFCVATNQNYEILGCSLYNDKILAYALEEKETQYAFKLLVIALDGSAADELATVLTLEKTADQMYFGGCDIHIHRNKVLLDMSGSGGTEDSYHCGSAVVDLDTKEVTFLNDEPFSKDNVGIWGISAYGDYFYYCQKEGRKKTVLRRYHIETGTVKTCKLLTNFSGDYAVLDEDCVIYSRKSGLCTYRFSTGENEEKTDWQGKDLLTDGTYVYVPDATPTITTREENGELVTRTPAPIYVLDKNLEKIVELNMENYLPLSGFEEMTWHTASYNEGLRYLGEDIYWCLYPLDENNSNPEMTTYVFHCKRSDFLAGEPEFTYVYKYSEN